MKKEAEQTQEGYGKELAVKEPVDYSLVPKTMQELLQFADILAKSDFVPKDYIGKPGNCVVAIMMGREVGLGDLAAVQGIAVINGRPTIWGDTALALVMGSSKLKEFDEDSPDVCLKQGYGRCFIWRKGDAKGSEYKFTVDMAKQAGLWGKQGPWSTTPGRMMQLRARGFALRDKAPDVLKGLSIREEVMDYTTELKIDDKTSIVKPQRRSDSVAGISAKDQGEAIKQTKSEDGYVPGSDVGETSPAILIEKVTHFAFGDSTRWNVYLEGKKYWTDNKEMAQKSKEWSDNKTPVVYTTDKERLETIAPVAEPAAA